MEWMGKRLQAWVLAVVMTLLGAPASLAAQDESADVEVMVIGSFHFVPSRSDLIAPKPSDVMTPERQAELERLTAALLTFKPTAVAVENVGKAPDYLDAFFKTFSPAKLAENASEVTQIAYRLAAAAGITRVYAIDERSSEGEPDYFPFGAVLEHMSKTGRRAEFDAMFAKQRALIEAEQARMNEMTIPRALYEANTGPLGSADFYYRLLDYDQGEEQPGAVLNAHWFMRNAKTFAKLMDVAEPGDRIVVLFGAGHLHWLRHLVENTPGYTFIDPGPYLLAADE